VTRVVRWLPPQAAPCGPPAAGVVSAGLRALPAMARATARGMVTSPWAFGCTVSMPGEWMPKQVALWIRMTPVILLSTLWAPATAWAEGGQLNVLVDLEYLFSTNDSENDLTGEEINTDFSRLRQKYDIELQKEIYPFLNFRGGGVFDLINTDSTTETSLLGVNERFDTNDDERAIWLFGELNLENPLYTAGVAYRRRRFEEDLTGIPKTTDYREEYEGLFRWRPVGFPLVDLDYTHFNIWNDDEFDPRDNNLDRFILKSWYSYRDFAYDYTYTRLDDDDRVKDLKTLNQLHDARANYSRRFYGDRLLVTTGLRVNYQTLDLSGTGEYERPVFPPGDQLFRQDDDSPTVWTQAELDAALLANSIIIGSPIPPTDPASAGLYFDSPTRVDLLYLPTETGDGFANPSDIAGMSYSWTLYVSDDGLNWDARPVVDATYSRPDRRFELSIPLDEYTYIKVVAIPQPSILGTVEIRSIQALLTITVAGDGLKIEDLDQTYNLGLQWEVTDRTTASYDGFYRMVESHPFETRRTTLSNGLSLRHLFSPWLYGNARVLRTDGTEQNRGDSVDHLYTASLTADWLDTLRQTFVYSGRNNKQEDETTNTNSFLLRTDADLYEGWSADLDLGYSWKNANVDNDTTNTTMRISTDVDPNPRLNLGLDYLLSWNTETGLPSSLDHTGRFQGFWVPLRTLSFFASVGLRYKERDQRGLQIDQDYSVNWAPFPDGLLNLSLAYNHSVDTRDNRNDIFSAQMDLQLTRTTLLTVRYNVGTLADDRQTSDLQNVRVTLRSYYSSE
jgi:hypothetical protein